MNAVAMTETLNTGLAGAGIPWLESIRQQANKEFAVSGFPSPKEEEWKYTNLAPLTKKIFQLKDVIISDEVKALADNHTLQEAWVFTLVNGRFCLELSKLEDLPANIIVTNLAVALQTYPERVSHWWDAALEDENHGFIHFNTAQFSDGIYIDIAPGIALRKPLQILHLVTENEALAVTRNVIALGANTEANIIETYAGISDKSYLTAAVSEIGLEKNAFLTHSKVQVESTQAYHFGGVYVRQSANSRFKQGCYSFGSAIARNEIHCRLGFAAECELNGLFLGTGRQHVDNHTLIHHKEPFGTSRETYRGVLAERARGVFQGRIVVHPKAQRTNAEMNNRNLLLSEDAEIDAKPQLEILADDVKCAHGVAIGQLDPESVFYLVSRGVDNETARNMLTFAFANEMVEKIEDAGLKAQVQQHLLDLFPQTGIRRDWL